MKLLVLGGTVFLSKAVAAEAIARGYEVVCACRGESGEVPEGARLVRWDRSAERPPIEEIGEVDAVVDVARQPSWVRSAVAAWPQAHWVFVSTVSVYAEDMPRGGTPQNTPLREPEDDDLDLDLRPDAYGPMKVGCEKQVLAGAASAMIIRPGLIAGPGDPTSRFAYWPERLAEASAGEPVLAGGDQSDPVQVLDVGDLARWIVTVAQAHTTGTADAVGIQTSFGDLLSQVARGVGSQASLVWVPSHFLARQGVVPWMGPDALPLWLPRPENDPIMTRDPQPALDAGLELRPVEQTARQTLAWLRSHPQARRTGMSREREREVLDSVTAEH